MRKYLDRSRKIALHGRPIAPDWMVLLFIGHQTVTTGKAESASYLESVMWEGIDERGRQLKPATLDPQMITQWLDVDEKSACDTLRKQWGMLRAPESKSEALAMLASPDCLTADLGEHRLTAPWESWVRPDGEWAVGHCRDCTRALLWKFSDDGDIRTWPFYEHVQ